MLTLPDPGPAPKKVFKAKFNLPPISDYRGAGTDAFWDRFPRRISMTATSLVCPIQLRQLAGQLGGHAHPLLELVCRDLTAGADIGCRGAFRGASTSSNAPSAHEF